MILEVVTFIDPRVKQCNLSAEQPIWEGPRKFRGLDGHILCTFCWEGEQIQKRADNTIESNDEILHLCQIHYGEFEGPISKHILGVREDTSLLE